MAYVQKAALISLFLVYILSISTADDAVYFTPHDRVLTRLYSSANLQVTYSTDANLTYSDIILCKCNSARTDIAIANVVGNYSLVPGSAGTNVTFICKIESLKIGRTQLSVDIFTVTHNDDGTLAEITNSTSRSIPGIVAQPKSVWNQVAQYGLIGALALNSVAFGLKIDWKKVKDFIQKPGGIFLAVGCQYVLLPVVAFLTGLAMDMEPYLRVALLCVSCVPGGIPSNILALTLGGDINLSIVLTSIGNISAFAMTPLWIYTLGQSLIEKSFPTLTISIPWLIFCIFIAVLTVPTITGIAVGVRHPKIADKLALGFRVVGVSTGLALIGIVIWVYEWVFYYFTWEIVIGVIATCYITILVSFGLSYLFLRSLQYSITISVETSIQNISFSFFLLGTCIPEPESSLGTSVVGVVVLATYIPFILLGILKIIVMQLRKRRGQDDQSSGSTIEEPSEMKVQTSQTDVNENNTDVKFHKSESTTALV